MCKDPYTFAAFISPSGDGLKVLFKIPEDKQAHAEHYLGIVDYCKEKGYPDLDTTSKNLSRVCFVSFDPDIYVNKESEIFTGKKKEEVKTVSEAQNTDFAKLQIVCEMVRNSNDGNKHHNLIKASRLAGGFISGGFVEEYEAVRLLEAEINRKSPDNFKLACKTIQDGIEYGKKEPIEKTEWKKAVDKARKEEIIIEDEPAKDVILCKDVEDKIIYSFLHGTSRGESTHFSSMDGIYRMKKGELTLFHGIPNHGKSAFVYQLAVIKSAKDGHRWGIFSPENIPEEEFYKDLIHAYIGKSTEKHHHNVMTEEELRKGIEFVHNHFFLICPENDLPTIDYMNNRFRELIIKHRIDGCIIDPYNQMENDIMLKGGREDQYLSWFLTCAKRFAIEQNVFYFIITHPKTGLKKEGGNYECPGVYHLSGGAMWYNKCDNIVCVHRPNFYTDPSDELVFIQSQKIKKQKINGMPGTIELKYDRFAGRYYEENTSPLGSRNVEVKEVKNYYEPYRDEWEEPLF
jgi:twinkle protein